MLISPHLRPPLRQMTNTTTKPDASGQNRSRQIQSAARRNIRCVTRYSMHLALDMSDVSMSQTIDEIAVSSRPQGERHGAYRDCGDTLPANQPPLTIGTPKRIVTSVELPSTASTLTCISSVTTPSQTWLNLGLCNLRPVQSYRRVQVASAQIHEDRTFHQPHAN